MISNHNEYYDSQHVILIDAELDSIPAILISYIVSYEDKFSTRFSLIRRMEKLCERRGFCDILCLKYRAVRYLEDRFRLYYIRILESNDRISINRTSANECERLKQLHTIRHSVGTTKSIHRGIVHIVLCVYTF